MDVASDLSNVNTKLLNQLVDHPVPVLGPNKPVEVGPLPLMLTKRERKKIRTQGRIAREKEKQEQIKLGLVEPPKPKVKCVLRLVSTHPFCRRLFAFSYWGCLHCAHVTPAYTLHRWKRLEMFLAQGEQFDAGVGHGGHAGPDGDGKVCAGGDGGPAKCTRRPEPDAGPGCWVWARMFFPCGVI